jgi:hypothetical protein
MLALGIEAEERIGKNLVIFIYDKPIELELLKRAKKDEPVYEE